MIQAELFDRVVNPEDVVYTPDHIAKHIIDLLQPSGVCVDPCKGDGAFYKHLPEGSLYCELREGSDFLLFKQRCDWIIGNPPYSVFKDFLDHSFELSDNVSFLVPTNKIFQRQVIMESINRYGGIKSMVIYGSGQLLGFPFGFSVGNFHFQRGYKGASHIIMGMNTIKRY
jgi:hypothetical protein